jgi:hypothetical protein
VLNLDSRLAYLDILKAANITGSEGRREQSVVEMRQKSSGWTASQISLHVTIIEELGIDSVPGQRWKTDHDRFVVNLTGT